MSWRDEIDIALRERIAASGADRGGEPWRRVGLAREDGEPGRFLVDVGAANLSPDRAEEMRLAGPDGSSVMSEGFPVMDAVLDGETLRVHVAEFAALPEPYLWLREQEPAFLVEKLRGELAALSDAGLANRLASGEAGGALSPASPPAWLEDGQQDAYRACLGEGLWLVWGPPGNGKTRVLRAAIGDLLATGKRVLLASASTVAVDNALLGVLAERRFAPGEIVRVGPPQLAELAGNPDVCLPLLVRAKLAHVERQRRALAGELRAMNRRQARLQALGAQLAGFDPARYEAAVALLATPGGSPSELAAALAQCETEIDRDLPALAAAREERDTALAAVAEADPARPVWARVAQLEAALSGVDENVTQARVRALKAKTAVDIAAGEVTALRQPNGKVRWRDHRAHQDAQATLATARAEHERLRDAAAKAESAAQAARRDAERKIAALTASVPFGRDEIQRRDAAAERTRIRVRVLDRAQRTRLARKAKLRAAQGAAREAEELVTACRQRGWPDLHAAARSLGSQTAKDSARRRDVRERHDKFQAACEHMARGARGEVIASARLVATTLARFATVKAVVDGPYDVVLIDEAAAASLAEALLAVAKAGTCAVMLGDCTQRGPALDGPERGDNEHIRKWLSTDPFRHCGISSLDEAREHPSCLVLDTA